MTAKATTAADLARVFVALVVMGKFLKKESRVGRLQARRRE